MRHIVRYATLCMVVGSGLGLAGSIVVSKAAGQGGQGAGFEVPRMWEYSGPLIGAEKREVEVSHAQKDPTVVFYGGRWHVFMTVKLQGKSAIEYCSFEKWADADASKRTILRISSSDYYCAPQVFYFRPHGKWYLVYQMGVPGANKMWVAYSTTTDIADPDSWTQAAPILDGGPATLARKAAWTTGSSATISGRICF